MELPDEPLHADVTDEEAWAYERMVERIMREGIVGKRVLVPRTIVGVEVRGHYPEAQVVIAFRSDDGSEGEALWELWDPESMLGDPEHGRLWEAPTDLAHSIGASWARPPEVRITKPAPHN